MPAPTKVARRKKVAKKRHRKKTTQKSFEAKPARKARKRSYEFGGLGKKINLSATEVARSFSDVVSRVHYTGVTVTVERGGDPVCRIVPVGSLHATIRDLVEVLSTVPAADDRFADDLDAIVRSQATVEDAPWEC